MHSIKEIKITLGHDIEDAARMAGFWLMHHDVRPDCNLTFFYPHRVAWEVTCERRGQSFTYLVMNNYPYLFRPSGATSARPIIISGLALVDRENVLKALIDLIAKTRK